MTKQNEFAGAVASAVARVALRDDNPLSPDMAPDVSAAILDQVQGDPSIRHLANQEPWYRSRVTWGALVAGLSPLFGLIIGHELKADEQASLVELGVAIGTLAGAALALYGRWRARRPIGA